MIPLPLRPRCVRIGASALLALAGLGVTGVTPSANATASGPAQLSVASSGRGATAYADVPAALRGDAVRNGQWQLGEFRAPTAWRLSTGKGVTVAVIDSGVDGSHPDLAGQVLPGTDLVQPPGNGQSDLVGHGTTVAALIAGRKDDRTGVVGLAPDAKILPVRVLDAENRYDDAMIVARAVRWAVDNGAKVINLSLGGSGDSPALASAIDYAFASDVVVVACTGNVASTGSGTGVWYPAREPGVVAVAGLRHNGNRLWSGSLTGRETALTAPATDLLGARPGGYWRVQGTSFAAPLVAATAALIRSRWPTMSAGDVVNRLIRTARDLGPAGRDSRFGFGRLDPVAALSSDVAPVGENPLDDHSSPSVVGFGSAPGRASVPATTEPTQLGPSLSVTTPGWAVRPAGHHESQAPGELWGGGALFVIVVVGGALLARRSVRTGDRRRGPGRS